jgi:hypothetical protein
VVVVLVMLAATVLAVPAAAGAASHSIPWHRFRTGPWHDAPGKVCTFGVSAKPVKDGEQTRILARYPNGKPRVQEFRGPLYVRYTNTHTGKSVTGNLSGYGWFFYGRSGGTRFFVASHVGLTVDVGNKGYPAGEWIINGQAWVRITSAGDTHIHPLRATAENLCRTLS